jgi:hypothetical protein
VHCNVRPARTSHCHPHTPVSQQYDHLIRSFPSSTEAPRDKHVAAGNRTRAACVLGEQSSSLRAIRTSYAVAFRKLHNTFSLAVTVSQNIRV